MKKGKPNRPWTEEELEYLSEHYGALPDEVLARRLGRSQNAIKIAITRKLKGLRHINAFYTARMLAMLLGRKDPKIVARWVHNGWLKAVKGPAGAGRNKIWNITEDDIATLLKQQPWLADLKAMDEHYFRSIIRAEWKRDPWYSTKQVASCLGVKSSEPVLHYIHNGWLAAEAQSHGHGRRGWVIRESAIQAFLKNDLRREHRSTLSRVAKINANIRQGIPIRISTLWQVKCPTCGNMVTVAAPAQMAGWRMKEKFIALFTNDECTHAETCSIHDCPYKFDFSHLALAGSRVE